MWCEYWVLPFVGLSFTPCCEKYSFYVGNILSFDSKKCWKYGIYWLHMYFFFSIILAATSNMLDYLAVCSVFCKKFAVIYVNISVL